MCRRENLCDWKSYVDEKTYDDMKSMWPRISLCSCEYAYVWSKILSVKGLRLAIFLTAWHDD